MKFPSVFLVAGALFTVSCADNTTPASTPDEKTSTSPATACYIYTGSNNKDTVTLELVTAGTKVTGNLAYRLQEKDANKGTISGGMHGDTLVADYTFLSEGMESMRQVVFLKKNGSLTEGYGEMEDKNGRMVFKENTPLNFSGIILLKKVDCGN